jgi:hypothetical protein
MICEELGRGVAYGEKRGGDDQFGLLTVNTELNRTLMLTISNL